MSNLISIVTSSEKRRGLLILLNNGPKSLEEIKNSLHVTASGVLPQIKILEEEGLIIKEEKRYILTDIGQPVVYHLKPFEDTLAVIDRQKKFLQEHDLKALPHDFF